MASFHKVGDRLVCMACGTAAVMRTPSFAVCPACTAAKPQPGLGDMVKAGLSAIGITEERVSKALGRPCGCGKRAARLNKFGHKYLGLPPGHPPAT